MNDRWSSSATPAAPGGPGGPAAPVLPIAPGAEAVYRLMADNRDGVVIVDRRGGVLFANPAAERLLRPAGGALAGAEFGLPAVSGDMAEVDVTATGTVAEMRVAPVEWEGRPAELIMLRNVTARRRAGREEERNTALLTEAERVAGLGSWELETATGHFRRSPGYLRILGRRPDDQAMYPYLGTDAVHPDDRTRWRQALDRARSGKQRLDLEYRIVRPDGEVRTIREVAEAVGAAGGRPERLLGIIRDVTEERRAERAHRDAVRMLEEISDKTAAAISVRSPEGRFMFVNARIEEITGHDREQLKSMTLHDLLPQSDADEVRTQDLEVLEKNVSVTRTHTLPFPGGTRRTWLSVKFPVHDDDGLPCAVGDVSVDATAQRQDVEELQGSEGRFRLLADRSQDVIFLCRLGPEPVIEYVSPAAEKVLGLRAEELMGDPRRALALVHPDDRPTLDAHWRAADPGPAILRCVRPDGSLSWAEVRFGFLRDADGEITTVEGNLRDITDRVTAERERERLARRLDQVERLDALGRLAGGVAHDFNNLLAVIVGTAEFLAADLDADDRRIEDVERIMQAARRGAAFTRQLLIFGRREPSRPEIVDLNEIITRLEDLLRRTIGEDIEFVTRLSAGIPRVRIDRARIEQVLVNLVLNARTAMPAGGRLVVETAAFAEPSPGAEPAGPAPEAPGAVSEVPGAVPEAPGAEAAAVPGADGRPGAARRYLRLTVRDTGHGMPTEISRRAFEPFFTTRAAGGGSGLGLATVHGIVRDAGGQVELDSVPERGTTVRILLPAVDEVVEVAGPGEREAPRGRGECVLVVEDEDPVREVVTRMLDRNGYEVLAARDAAEAMEICADPDTRVDVMLTDIVMPGMPGTRLAERLHATSRLALPVIYMSGYAAESLIGMESDADILDKPFDAATVLRRIREAIDTAASHHGPRL